MKTMEIFKKSFEIFMKNKISILPNIIMNIFITLLLLTSLFITSMYEPVMTFLKASEDYNVYKSDAILNGNEYQTFQEYLTANNLTNMFEGLLTPYNILVIVLFLILTTLLTAYLVCMSNCVAAMCVKNEKITIKKLISFTNKKLFSFIKKDFLISLIIIVPIIISFAIFLILLNVNQIVGAIAFILLFLISIIWIVFFSLKIFFNNAVLFLDNKKALETIKNSFNFSKGKMKYIFYIIVIISAMNIMNNYLGIVLDLISELTSQYIIVELIVSFIIIVSSFVLTSFIGVLSDIFIFSYYLELKKVKKISRK